MVIPSSGRGGGLRDPGVGSDRGLEPEASDRFRQSAPDPAVVADHHLHPHHDEPGNLRIAAGGFEGPGLDGIAADGEQGMERPQTDHPQLGSSSDSFDDLA